MATFMGGRKAFAVYVDLIKDIIFLLIIVNALGGISNIINGGWTFAATVSNMSFCFPICNYLSKVLK